MPHRGRIDLNEPEAILAPPVAEPAGDSIQGYGFVPRATAYFIDVIYIVLLNLLSAALAGMVVGVEGVIRGRPVAFDKPTPEWFNLAVGLLGLTLYSV